MRLGVCWSSLDWVKSSSERKDRLGGGWPEAMNLPWRGLDSMGTIPIPSLSCISLLAMLLDCGLFADFFRSSSSIRCWGKGWIGGVYLPSWFRDRVPIHSNFPGAPVVQTFGDCNLFENLSSKMPRGWRVFESSRLLWAFFFLKSYSLGILESPKLVLALQPSGSSQCSIISFIPVTVVVLLQLLYW
jgi:hypothetical protein